MVNRAGTMALPFLVLYLTRNEGYSPTEAGAMMSLYGAAALVAGPLAGRLSDRVGPGRLMPVSLAASGALLLLVPLARTPIPLAGLVVVWAIAAETFRPASSAMVASSVPPELRKQAFALLRLAVNVGMSGGPALGGVLASHSFAWLFRLNGLTSLGAGIMLGLARLPTTSGGADSSPRPRLGVLSDPRVRSYLVGMVVVASVFFQSDSALPLYLVRDLGLSVATYGGLFSVNTMLIVLLEVPLTSAIAHWEARRTLAWGALLVGVGFGALALTSGFWGVLASVVIWTFGEMLFSPSSAAYASELAPASQVGEVMGLYTASWSLAFTFAPLLGTLGLQLLGGRGHWVAVLAAGLVGTLLLRGGVQRRKPAPSIEAG